MDKELSLTVKELIQNAIKSNWQKFDQSSKNIFYHYTSSEGLLGIIGSDSLWATSIDFLNDPNELTYGINLCQKIVDSLNEINEHLKTALSLTFEIFKENRRQDDLIPDLYVISFCEHHEILGQWRLYGKNGEGYCLGLNIDNDILLVPEFGQIEEQDEIEFIPIKHPKPVLYNINQQSELIKNIILEVNSELMILFKNHAINPSIDPSLDVSMKFYLTVAHTIVANILPFIKKSEFIEEKEWRIVISFNNKMKRMFKTEKGVLIPFTVLNFFGNTNDDNDNKKRQIPIPINEIIIGQALNFQRANQGLRYLLKTYKRENVNISRSKIEFI